MIQTTPQSSTPQQFDDWLAQQILALSVDTLSQGIFTCTACPKVAGDYIIDYQGASLRLSAAKAYAFLQYIRQTTTA
ncbi:hypothetical protein IQ266_18155 [filamentous cyanobacterium LEGE 11480]|uniref:Uncharacterized protein n=1 Tax=Romeriopsis navalis LEGE 11480 TaxID=2777977 RepID=A0A928VT82_9CYAN|nr:hypothetical protein [Romeriopsis navalis]MBE9031659.1 hypothetical protein [Romeriopsis navalis LEGE 11480]